METGQRYLRCEKRGVYFLLMMVSGMMGAYTYNLRGGVFCNAQTANVLMMSVAFGQGRVRQGLYYLIPITAYALGAFVSEILPSPVKRRWHLRWDTLLIGLEIATLLAIGLVPLSAPARIIQVLVNFIASMQYNTFRQAEGIPMATTFCTNHVRQVGIALARFCRKGGGAARERLLVHLAMIAGFILGAALLSLLGSRLQERSIWLALVPLLAIGASLVRADMVTEKDEMERKPSGH